VSDMKLKACLGLAGVLIAACTSATDSAPFDATKAVLSGEAACPLPEQGAHVFWVSTPSVEPGERLTLTPYFTQYPGMMERMEAGCVGELKSEPEGALVFSRMEDGTAVATVADTVENGAKIRVEGVYDGRKEIWGPINVFRKDANPIVGIWKQSSKDCAGASAILELSFNADMTFSVTWRPFEAYRDYWGDYTFDAETGELTLTPDGGNYVPEDVSSGKVKLETDTLIPGEGMSFGSIRGGQSCSAAFTRR
jgi:hypothetical protein